ncbi:MAG: response regulator transcription factor [Acidobacteria bacterium]|nr:response regulator transcription factor [Acidobacteriota bacterium]
MKFRALIADDEPLARARLRRMLATDAEITVVKECRNGREVIAAVKQMPIDLLLLDIEMPGMNGFGVIEQIGVEEMPAVIFVTAHDSYALKAFDVHAVDYLMKPVEPARLQAALRQVKDRIRSQADGTMAVQLRALLERFESDAVSHQKYNELLLVPNGIRQTFVKTDEIDWIEAADYCVVLHVGSKSYTLRQTIKQLARQLDPTKFVRVHRSIVVNVGRVKEIIRESNAENWAVLSGGQRIKMSKGGRRTILQQTRLPNSDSRLR